MRRWLLTSLLFLLPAAALADLPLVAERTIAFETQRVSWLSVDVSPDGSTLVMEVLGDIYVAPASGGESRRLTQGPAFDSQPRFSPDGARITFLSDRSGAENVWIMDADGGHPRQLSQEKDGVEFASPTFSPGGDHVVVSRSTWALRTYELWAYHLDGGKGVQITNARPAATTPANERPNTLGAAYSPDGRFLYYARKNGGFAYNASLPMWQIARRDLRDGTEVIITEDHGSAMRPVLSPDGKSLVYAVRHRQQTGLRLRDLLTGTDRWLRWPVEHDEQESRFTRDLMPGYAFAPDGRSLYVAIDGQVHRLRIEDGVATPIPLRFAVEQQLGPRLDFPHRTGVGPVRARLLLTPTLSPDGNRLAFSAFLSLFVHDLVKNRTTQLLPDGTAGVQPAWSPDGRSLFYAGWDGESGHIWRIGANGGKARRITNASAYYSEPVVSPDGRAVYALRGSRQDRLTRDFDLGQTAGADLVKVDVASGKVTVVAPATDLSRPHFGPEADRIYLFASPGVFAPAGVGSLVSMRLDGSDRRTHLSVRGPGIYRAEEEVSPEAMQLSPNGVYVLVRHAAQLYVVQQLGSEFRGVTQSLSAASLPMYRLTDVGADAMGWSNDGRTVWWTVGHTLHTRALASMSFQDDDTEATVVDGPDTQTKPGEMHDDRPREDHDTVATTVVDLYRPRHFPRGTVALVNATLHTMEAGTAPVPHGVLLITDGRIRAVGAAADVEIPQEATVIDLSGKHVLPGFIDTHAHYRPMRDLLDGGNASFLANLAYGVTTGIDVQPSTVDIIAYEDLIDAGLMTGPRTLSTGPGVFSNNIFRSAAHVENVLRRYRDHYGVHNIKAYLAGRREQRQWVVQACRKLGLMPTTEGGLDMKLDLTHVLDGFSGNEHNFPLVTLQDDIVQLVARAGLAYTPTLIVTYGGPWGEGWFYTRESPVNDAKLNRFTPYPELAGKALRRMWAQDAEYTHPRLAAQARKLVDAGGNVGIGAHGQLQGLGYHWEMWLLASGGMTSQQILTSATRMGAEMIGVEQDLGTLTAGKLADMVVLDADPLTDIRNTARLNRVIKGGEIYDASTLDQQWPVEKPLADQWWWHLEPVAPAGE
ncbi:MAG: PD40 domain-containing protein [Pseudomonadales bacterium]|nr:PD40 domain-containing protein [Pseudomonadales bacterium]